MQNPQIVYVLRFEPIPELAGPAPIFGVFRDDQFASGLDHAKNRAAMLFAIAPARWEEHDGEPEYGISRGWHVEVRGEGTYLIEPHGLEPLAGPPVRRVGRRPRP